MAKHQVEGVGFSVQPVPSGRRTARGGGGKSRQAERPVTPLPRALGERHRPFPSEAPHLGCQGSQLSRACSPLQGVFLFFHSCQNGFLTGPQICQSLEHKPHEGSNSDYLFNAVSPVPMCLAHGGSRGHRNICEGMSTTHSTTATYYAQCKALTGVKTATFLNLLVSKPNLQDFC